MACSGWRGQPVARAEAAAPLLTTMCRSGVENSERAACRDKRAVSEQVQVKAEARKRDSISFVTTALNLARTLVNTQSMGDWRLSETRIGDRESLPWMPHPSPASTCTDAENPRLVGV